MILKELSILNYKNLAEAHLQLSSSINCFIGGNGQGKTNILDAIHFLSMCKSSTVTQDSQVVRHLSQMMMLQAHLEREDGTQEEISCGLRVGQKKVFRRGQKAYKRLADHIGFMPVVMISPSDQNIILGAGEERRRYMDMIISQCDPAYLDALTRYNHALANRNTLLKQEEEPDPDLLDVWEEAMGRYGEFISRKRAEFVERIHDRFQEYYTTIAQNGEAVGMEYTTHCQRGPLTELLHDHRAKDRIMGYSLIGPHRDDLEMTLNDHPIKREGSQGQNKTFSVALKLSEFYYLREEGQGTTPILLLDDIFDKLDADRVEQIVHLVAGQDFGQIFITDTNRDHLDRILEAMPGDHRLFRVSDGNISL